MGCGSSTTKDDYEPDDSINELEESIDTIKKRKLKQKENYNNKKRKKKTTENEENEEEEEKDESEEKEEEDDDNEENESEEKEEEENEEREEEEDENANDTLPPSAPTRKSLKIQDYNNGIILAENIKQVFQPNLSKESIISMIKAALNQSQAKRNRNQKRLSPKQIATIGSIIHSTLSKKGKQQRKSFAEPITHPLLKNVLVKVGLRDLTPDLLKQTCFKDKAVTNEEIKKALEDMAQGNNTSDIKVLTIEIS